MDSLYPGKQFNIPRNKHGNLELLGDTKSNDYFKIQDIENLARDLRISLYKFISIYS